jgi:spore coat protein SA
LHNAHLQTANPAILHDLDIDRVVFVSRYLADASQSTLSTSVATEVLHNGADGYLFHPVQPDEMPTADRPMKVLFASRVVKEKGPQLLAEALRRLQQMHVAVVGIVVGGAGFGNSEPDPFVAELVRSAPQNLAFHPYCAGEKLARLFQQADVFCLPSIWHDPFPLAPLEAMAAGLPVVASHSGGIPEALFDGGGILVERDSVESLTAALRQLAEDVPLRRRLSVQARRSFERHFQWENVRENYGTIMRSIQHV